MTFSKRCRCVPPIVQESWRPSTSVTELTAGAVAFNVVENNTTSTETAQQEAFLCSCADPAA